MILRVQIKLHNSFNIQHEYTYIWEHILDILTTFVSFKHECINGNESHYSH